ncbi:MAG: lasso peptide biosynthesis B2 protein [Candidatus Acidiferrales bacterium]
MATWNRFWKLGRRDRIEALQVGAVILASRIGLRVAGYRRWKFLLSRLTSRNVCASHIAKNNCVAPADPGHFARIAESAARNLPFHPTCLERSFGLWWLLRRRGFDADLRIGGRKDGKRFEAHAWVEYSGTPLNDVGDEHNRFSAFGNSSAFVTRDLP